MRKVLHRWARRGLKSNASIDRKVGLLRWKRSDQADPYGQPHHRREDSGGLGMLRTMSEHSRIPMEALKKFPARNRTFVDWKLFVWPQKEVGLMLRHKHCQIAAFYMEMTHG